MNGPRARWPLLALVAATACEQKPPEPTMTPLPRPPPAQASANAAADAGPVYVNPIPQGVVVLDEARLKRYLGYQEAMALVSAEVSGRSVALAALFDGGTAPDAKAVKDGFEVVKRQNEARTKAVEASGMTPAELAQVERMVSELLRERLLGPSNPEMMTQQIQEAMSRLPPERQADFQHAVSALQERARASATMGSLRLRWGDANIDLLLAHEAALRGRWDALLHAHP